MAEILWYLYLANYYYLCSITVVTISEESLKDTCLINTGILTINSIHFYSKTG